MSAMRGLRATSTAAAGSRAGTARMSAPAAPRRRSRPSSGAPTSCASCARSRRRRHAGGLRERRGAGPHGPRPHPDRHRGAGPASRRSECRAIGSRARIAEPRVEDALCDRRHELAAPLRRDGTGHPRSAARGLRPPNQAPSGDDAEESREGHGAAPDLVPTAIHGRAQPIALDSPPMSDGATRLSFATARLPRRNPAPRRPSRRRRACGSGPLTRSTRPAAAWLSGRLAPPGRGRRGA